MPGELLVARNPDPDSTLPFLLRLPLGPDGLVLKTTPVPQSQPEHPHESG